jgi:thiamine monophosphate synthase
MEDAIATAEGIKGFQVTYDASALEELTETIQAGNKLGLSWNGRQKEAA